MKQRRVDEAGDHRDIVEMQHAFEEAFGDRALAGDAVKSEGAILFRRDRVEQRVILRLAEQHLLRRCFRTGELDERAVDGFGEDQHVVRAQAGSAT